MEEIAKRQKEKKETWQQLWKKSKEGVPKQVAEEFEPPLLSRQKKNEF